MSCQIKAVILQLEKERKWLRTQGKALKSNLNEKTTLLNGKVKTFITKEYESYNPEKKKVNGLYQIGFIKDGKTRMNWTPIGADKYDHNVKEVVISDATTGRRIETIIATH